nr:hypothetical protein [Tanacetum cinerariifolium]
ADVERAVGALGEATGAVVGAARSGFLSRAREVIGKNLPLAAGLAIREGLERHHVAGLRLGRTVPGTVEGDESAVAVLGREHGAGVEQQAVG